MKKVYVAPVLKKLSAKVKNPPITCPPGDVCVTT